SYANAINDSGQIVGDAVNAAGGLDAFLYSNGTMTDLNTLLPANSGWQLQTAAGINNKGVIAGVGTAPDGSTDAYTLYLNGSSTPTPTPPPSPTPSPTPTPTPAPTPTPTPTSTEPGLQLISW